MSGCRTPDSSGNLLFYWRHNGGQVALRTCVPLTFVPGEASRFDGCEEGLELYRKLRGAPLKPADDDTIRQRR